MRSRALSLPPKKRRLSPRGGSSLPAVDHRELAEGGQAGPAEPCLCLGLGKFEGLFRPATLPKILSREKVAFQARFVELLLHATH